MTVLHAIIIGAGPAGCAAAFHLARAGVRVTLIERKPFPRLKVCGEYIAPAATRLLEAIIPAASLHTMGARTINSMVLHAGTRSVRWNAAPAWSLSRALLDLELLNRAVSAGAEVLQPASVRDVQYHGNGVTVTLSDGRDIAADIVVHADGSGRHDPAGPVPLTSGLIGHKCHLHIPGGAANTVTMRACTGAYIGTIGIEDGLFTCALVADRAMMGGDTGPPDVLLTSLWPQYQPSWRSGPWVSSGVPRSAYISPGHARSFRIGNAAAAVDPVGGEGIGLALWAGTTLAQQLTTLHDADRLNACAQHVALTHNHATFKRAYNARLRTRLPACRTTGALLMRPRLVRALWPLTIARSLSVAPWLLLTGKHASGRASPDG